jgi:DNA-binding protein H-NS
METCGIFALCQSPKKEPPMKSLNLKSMSADALIDLRSEIDKVLSAKVAVERKELRAKLDKLDLFGKPARGGKGVRSHPLKGGKVAPRFRGPDGETWSGRGLRPKWLTAQIEQGRSLEEFAIDNAGTGKPGRAAKPAKKRGRGARKAA